MKRQQQKATVMKMTTIYVPQKPVVEQLCCLLPVESLRALWCTSKRLVCAGASEKAALVEARERKRLRAQMRYDMILFPPREVFLEVNLPPLLLKKLLPSFPRLPKQPPNKNVPHRRGSRR